MLLLSYSKESIREIMALEAKQYRQVNNAILKLLADPRPQDSEKLTGTNDHYRVDAGEFRIVYRFDQRILWITTLGRRNDDQVYKQFKRKGRL